jgi:hypothetical protein
MRYEPEFEEDLIRAQDAFVWEAPAYDRHERGRKWYAIMGLVAVLLVAYAIWQANFLFAFIILIAAIILALSGNEKPRKVLVQIGRNGLVWNGDFLSFDEIDNFAIVYQPPHIRVLYVEPKSMLRPRMRVHIGEQDPVAIRDHMRDYVREDLDLRDEHASDILARLFKF